jgi:hypothetical protein
VRGYVRSRAGKEDKAALQHGGGAARSREGRAAASFRAAAVRRMERASVRSRVYCESEVSERSEESLVYQIQLTHQLG